MVTAALSIISGAMLWNLSDKLYMKRKNATLEIEGIVKQLTTAGEHEKISTVISLLTNDFTYSPQANHQKVCLNRYGHVSGLNGVQIC
ncbi:protein VAC14 homolog [Phragmites australis]|uniref:protein VAC14 homolog n=1 Tax=Phragmites australis TaxID=29695 RepID=UPI002D785F11|nr:protein VAC14 homolog [Phragmites australis]